MHIKFLLLSVIITSLACSSPQKQSSEPRISADVLKEDLSILHTTLKEAHPGLYWYTDSIAMDNLFDQTRKAIDRDMTSLEFFKLLLPVIAEIRCSHTGIRLPEDVQQQMASDIRHFLPFEFQFKDGNAYVRRSLNGPNLKSLEVVSINEVPMREILDRLLANIPSDGYNMGFKYSSLARGVITEGYAMHYGQSEVFKVETKDSTGQLQSFDVTAATVDMIRANIPAPLPIFSVEYRDSAALVAINSFLIEGEAFQDSISSIFRTIKERQIQKLIIDIRHNGGGNNENVSALFAYIARAPFRHLRYAEIMGRPLTYAQHIENANALDHYSRERPRDGKFDVNYSYVGTRETQPRNDNAFTDDVELLISANTNSAASEFAAIFKYNKRGVIVGEETGGCYYGSTGGTYLRLQLPGSRLMVTIPAVRIFNAVEEDFTKQPKGRGTLPES